MGVGSGEGGLSADADDGEFKCWGSWEVIQLKEIHDMFRLVNIYPAATIWLAFAWDAPCSEGCGNASQHAWYFWTILFLATLVYSVINLLSCKCLHQYLDTQGMAAQRP